MKQGETISEEEYRRLKRDVETSRAEAQRAKGAVDQLMTQLETEFECHSLKEAEALLERLETKRDTLHNKYTEAVDQYQRKWKS